MTGKPNQLTREKHSCGSPLYRVGSNRDLFCVSCSTKVPERTND